MRSVPLVRPAPGQHVYLPLAGVKQLTFSFNLTDVVFRKQRNALLLTFHDGATLELLDFFPEGEVPSLVAVLADATRMDALELLTLCAPHLILPQGVKFLDTVADCPAPVQPPTVADLSALAAEEEFLLSTEPVQASDAARHNLVPVYQEIIFQEDEIIIGPSIYGSLFPLGGESALHVHLDNSEAEMIDMDDLIARLPRLFPHQPPIRVIAVTGGPENNLIMDGKRLTDILETGPLEGLGTTQFDHYTYRAGRQTAIEVYLETLLRLIR